MGVKFDAVKDDKIEMMCFSGKNLMEVTDKVNAFISNTRPKDVLYDEEDAPDIVEKGWRCVPLGLAHSTEVKTFTDKFGFSEHRVMYHVVLTYKTVLGNE